MTCRRAVDRSGGYGTLFALSAWHRYRVDAADFRLVADSSVAVWEMVKRGMGVAPMLREIAECRPGVTRLLPELPAIHVPIWLVTHVELQATPRIRLVQGILAEELARM